MPYSCVAQGRYFCSWYTKSEVVRKCRNRRGDGLTLRFKQIRQEANTLFHDGLKTIRDCSCLDGQYTVYVQSRRRSNLTVSVAGQPVANNSEERFTNGIHVIARL